MKTGVRKRSAVLPEMEKGKVSSSPLFLDLTGEKLERAMHFFNAELRKVKKGDTLKKSGERLPFFGLLLEGNMEVALDDPEGHHLVMSHVTRGRGFGESYCYLKTESPISITALEDSTYLRMDLENLRHPAENDPLAAVLTERFITLLAKRTLQMNQRIQILSRLTIREKLLAFLEIESGKSGSDTVTVSMDREELAAWLGCNRSALSRELSNMKKEGILEENGNEFRLLI